MNLVKTLIICLIGVIVSFGIAVLFLNRLPSPKTEIEMTITPQAAEIFEEATTPFNGTKMRSYYCLPRSHN